MVMEVTVKNMVTVRPVRPTPRRSLWCSNFDLIANRRHTRIVYFYRPPDGSSSTGARDFFDSAVLKSALAEVLVPFYPVAGRASLDGDGRLEIDCNEEGVVFMEAESNVGLDEFGDFGPEHEPKFLQLVPQPKAFGSEHDISACPFLMLQVTRFRCGAASLGVAFAHLLIDGFAAVHFVNSWADTARGAEVTPPFIDRTVLAARDPPAPSFPHPEFGPAPCIETTPPPSTDARPFVTARFRLNPPEIGRLKSAAGQCSTYEALVAHTWRCTCIARELPANQKTRVHMRVSVLRRLDPPLPSNYLGNAVFSTVADATAREVTQGSLEEVASCRIRAALAKVDNAYVRSAVDCLQLQPEPSKMKRGAQLYGSPNLNVNSWVQLPIYGADFGWGRPVFMGPASALCEGMSYVFPGPTAADGLSVMIRLRAEAMERFKGVFYEFK